MAAASLATVSVFTPSPHQLKCKSDNVTSLLKSLGGFSQSRNARVLVGQPALLPGLPSFVSALLWPFWMHFPALGPPQLFFSLRCSSGSLSHFMALPLNFHLFRGPLLSVTLYRIKQCPSSVLFTTVVTSWQSTSGCGVSRCPETQAPGEQGDVSSLSSVLGVQQVFVE